MASCCRQNHLQVIFVFSLLLNCVIMKVEQLYTNCLSEAAYFIESDGEVAIIDPLRDYDHYIELAKQHGSKVKYIFETHFHADFVSGHLDLSKHTGAPIIYGPETVTKLPVTIATDGERFKIGKIEIEVLHTPGHTPNHPAICCMMKAETLIAFSRVTLCSLGMWADRIYSVLTFQKKNWLAVV